MDSLTEFYWLNSIHRLASQPNDQLAIWSVGWSIDRMTNCLNALAFCNHGWFTWWWLIDWPDWLDWLTESVILTGWPTFTHWLAIWLTRYMTEWLADWLWPDWLDWLTDWIWHNERLFGWLTRYKIEWLSKWLTDWLPWASCEHWTFSMSQQSAVCAPWRPHVLFAVNQNILSIIKVVNINQIKHKWRHIFRNKVSIKMLI